MGANERELPAGTVTFLFTDIEGSTRLFQEHRDTYPALLGTHNELLRAAFELHHGVEVKTEGDAFFVAFGSVPDALLACVAGQRAINAHPWPADAVIRVRMGVHTGAATPVRGDYVALAVHHAARVASSAHGGQVVISDATASLSERLPDDITLIDLGEHMLKDLPSPIRLHQLDAPGLAREFAPLRTQPRRRHNLPENLTSFVGRVDELARLADRMDNRLVTLTGAGGSGKTRLAIEAARCALPQFGDGVWLVELGGTAGEGVVPSNVAMAIGVAQSEAVTTDSVAEFIGDRRILIVLDNCEHLLRECEEFVRALLERCSNLHVLATSRESLGLDGEISLIVPSLDVGIDGDAVRLFVERSRDMPLAPTNSEDDLAAIAAICKRLDGLPLAVELAAARCRVLTVAQIAERISDRFRLLTGGSSRQLGRQQTLRATIDWSYDLLAADERDLLERLSIFPGGSTLAAAEAVASREDTILLLDSLTRLVDKSLMYVDAKGQTPRYRMYESVRHYALDKLIHRGDFGEVNEAFAEWFVDLAARTPGEVRSREAEWYVNLDEELDNLRAATAVLAEARPFTALEAIEAVYYFWFNRGLFAEAKAWLESAFANIDAGDDSYGARSALVRGYAVLSVAHTQLFERDAALAAAGQALALDSALGEPKELADPAAISHYTFALAGDDAAILRARDRASPNDDFCAQLTAGVAINEFIRSDRSDAAIRKAEDLLGDALRVSEEFGTCTGSSFVLDKVARFRKHIGDHEGALASADRALELAYEIGNRPRTAFARQSWAMSAAALGRFDEAIAMAELGMRDLSSLDRRTAYYTAFAFGTLALALDAPERATDWLATALDYTHPGSAEEATASALLISAWIERGDATRVAELVAAAMKSPHRDLPEVCVARAEAALAQGETAEAVEHLRVAAEAALRVRAQVADNVASTAALICQASGDAASASEFVGFLGRLPSQMPRAVRRYDSVASFCETHLGSEAFASGARVGAALDSQTLLKRVADLMASLGARMR